MARAETMTREPKKTINGKQLTLAQAMTVRVALGSFHISLTAEGLGNDAAGQAICDGYLAQLQTIFPLMHEPK
jgi:hypothetical protein